MIASLKARFDAVPAPLQGLLLMSVSAVAFAGMHALIRYIAATGLHAFEIAFFRVFFAFIALSPIFFRQGFEPFRTNRLGLLAVRGGINAVAMLCFFYGLAQTELATATALSFTAPLFATVFAIFVLGEVVRLRRWSAIIIGFIGTLVVLRPGVVPMDIGPVLIVVSSVIWAGALMIIKILTRTESSVTITVYVSVFLSPITLIAALPFWIWPTVEQLVVLLLLACLGTVAQMSMNQALKVADATVVLPVDFTKLIWGAMFGFLLFGEIPTIWVWTGGLMIFAATTYIGVREARLKQEGRVERPQSTAVDRLPPTDDKPE